MDNTGMLSRRLVGAAVLLNVTILGAAVIWHPPAMLSAGIAAILSLIPLPFLITMIARRKANPAAFLVRQGIGFTAPPERRQGYLLVSQLLGPAALFWLALSMRRTDPTGGLFSTSLLVLIVLSNVLTYISVSIAMTRRPRLDLTPDGVRLLSPFRRGRSATWGELVPGVPTRLPGPDNAALTINSHGHARQINLDLRQVRVHGWFAADAIRYYVDHPERRAGIGTPSEYEHLLEALAAANTR
jgi:hypothetical protein